MSLRFPNKVATCPETMRVGGSEYGKWIDGWMNGSNEAKSISERLYSLVYVDHMDQVRDTNGELQSFSSSTEVPLIIDAAIGKDAAQTNAAGLELQPEIMLTPSQCSDL